MNKIRVGGPGQVRTLGTNIIRGREPLPWESGSVGGGDIGGAEEPALFLQGGVTDLSTTNYWASLANQGSGHVTTTTHAVLLRLDASTDADRAAFGRYNSSTGWAVYAKILSTNPGPAFFGGTTKIGDFGALTAGKTYLLVGTSDGSSVVRSYRNTNLVITESSTTAGAFTASNASSETGIGCLPNAGSPIQGATGVTIFGATSLSSVLSLSDIQTWFDTIRSEGTYMVPQAGTVVNHWVGTDAGAVWIDRVGLVSLTQNGSPTTNVVAVPDWG